MSRRSLFIGAIMVALLAPSFLLSGAANAQAAIKPISVSPTSGPVGTEITVGGSQFTPGYTICKVYFDGVERATCLVGQNGTFSVKFLVPTGAPLGKSERIRVCNALFVGDCGTEFSEEGFTSFEVTPPATTTTSSTTSTTAAPTTTSSSTTTSSTTTSTTTTTLPVAPGTYEPLPAGMGLGGGAFGQWTETPIVDGLIQIPPVLVLRCAPPDGATTIDFDDLDLGRSWFPIGWGRDANTVIEPRVGTFTPPHALQVTPATEEIGWRLSPSPGTRFRYFGMYVGLPEGSTGPVAFRLSGSLSSGGGLADADELILGPSPHPVSACLVVVAPEGLGIFNITLRAYGAGTSPIAIDTMFYDTERPYPIAGEPERAEVEIVYPAEGSRWDAARTFVVFGKVTFPRGFSVSRLNVMLPNWDRSGLTTHRAELGTVRLVDGRQQAWWWTSAVNTPPGETEIHAIATGSDLYGSDVRTVIGTGAASPPPDEYRELMAGEVDIAPWAMEVTQAVRGPLTVQRPGSFMEDDFRLVAIKKTVVRVYALQQFPLGPPDRIRPLEVSAVLHGTRDGSTLSESPLRPERATTTIVGGVPGPAAEAAARPYLSRTFTFVLPYTWTQEGDLSLRAEVNPTGDPFHIEEVLFTGGPQNTLRQRVHFTSTGRVMVAPARVDFYWRCVEADLEAWWHPCLTGGLGVGDTVSSIPSEGDVRNAVQEWWRMMPAAQEFPSAFIWSTVKIAQSGISAPAPLVTGSLSGVSYSDISGAFRELGCDSDSWFPTRIRMPELRVFGFFVTPWGAPAGRGSGCAWVGDRFMFRSNLSAATMAQEAGHAAGMRHSSNAHGESSGGSAIMRWTSDHGELGPPDAKAYGFNTYTMTPVSAGSTGGHVHDYMSYGDGVNWTAVDTWNHMFDALVRNASIGEGRGRSAAGGGGEPGSIEEALLVGGKINDDGTVEFTSPGLTAAGSTSGAGDDLVVELRDSTGEVLASTGAALLDGPTHGGTGGSTFLVELALQPDASELVVLRDGSEIGRVEAVAGLLEVNLDPIPPLDGSPVTFSWQGDAGLTYLLEASTDGEAWWPLGTTTANSFEIDPSSLPFAGEWIVRIGVTDGVRFVTDRESADFGERPPTALIGSPLDRAVVEAGMLSVQAAVSSVGDEDDLTFTWSVGGEDVAEGVTAMVPILGPGEHVIGLRVDGPGGSSEAAITVLMAFDTDGDGMPDDWEATHQLDAANADDGIEDPDEDLLVSRSELDWGTDPQNPDTDGDDYSDGVEIAGGSDPLDFDARPSSLHGVGDPAPRISGVATPQPTPGGMPMWVVLIGIVAIAVVVVEFMVRRRRGHGQRH